jgi:hypothetical protein
MLSLDDLGAAAFFRLGDEGSETLDGGGVSGTDKLSACPIGKQSDSIRHDEMEASRIERQGKAETLRRNKGESQQWIEKMRKEKPDAALKDQR